MPDTVMQTDAAPMPYRNRSPEIAKLAAALCKAQSVMEGATKDAVNPGFKSDAKPKGTSYADLASVWAAVRKPLTENGLCIVQFPRTVSNGVEIETTLLHTSGEFMCDVLWVPCGKNDAQGLGSAITYGRRYALMAVAGVAPVDDDGNAAVASHKPGTPGSAGGGGDFRPPGPRRAGNMVEEARADGTLNETRPKGQLADKPANGKKSAAEKAKEWTDKATDTLKLSGQTTESLKAFWKESADKIEWLEANAADQHERFIAAWDAANESAKVAA